MLIWYFKVNTNRLESGIIAIFKFAAFHSYGYLTYKSPEQAMEAAEKHKDVEMAGKKLLVVHYGSYVELPVRGEHQCSDQFQQVLRRL